MTLLNGLAGAGQVVEARLQAVAASLSATAAPLAEANAEAAQSATGGRARCAAFVNALCTPAPPVSPLSLMACSSRSCPASRSSATRTNATTATEVARYPSGAMFPAATAGYAWALVDENLKAALGVKDDGTMVVATAEIFNLIAAALHWVGNLGKSVSGRPSLLLMKLGESCCYRRGWQRSMSKTCGLSR